MATEEDLGVRGDAPAEGDVLADERADARPWLVRQWFLISTVVLLVVGIAAYLLRSEVVADWLWAGGTVIGLVVSIAWVVQAARDKQATVDVIAVLALIGSLIVREPLAGAVIAVMLATGRALEERSKARAERELRLLVARQPSSARRKDADGLTEIPVAKVVVGDLLVVGAGEIVPVDGRLTGPALLDESALTGEPMPVNHEPGDMISSGTVNSGQAFDFRATSTADSSTYSSIVRLVEQAQASSAPFVRMADRFAMIFVPLTLVIAGLAWLLSGDPVRAVAVLVVATPCPLILAAPIALISGMSQAARHGVVIKGGSALERLARGKVMLFDKTGTLTQGRPTLSNVVVGDPAFTADECLQLAASLDQVSPHVVATAIVSAAGHRGLELALPTAVI
ncbi:MAG: HAD-IC family P-type ATPase, partial [Actinomycetes bacterium]